MLYNEEIPIDEEFEGVDDSSVEDITEFDEFDENTDYDNNYQYTDIEFEQDTPDTIATPDPIPDETFDEVDPVPDPEYETVDEIDEIIIQNYDEEYLQVLEDDGYTFYVVYEDGTEDEVDISEIEEPTTSIEFLDDEAYVLANSILEHFWDDDSGVHVTQDTKEDWEQLVEDNFPDLDATHPHHNIIVNSYGVLIRSALKNLVQLSRSALAFYDGLGNNSSNIISTFGRGGIQIGPSDQKHLVINNNGITVYNGDGTVAPLTASNIQAIEANIQTLTASKANVSDLNAATARIGTLETNTADIDTIRANSAKVTNLTAVQLEAANAYVSALTAGSVTAADIIADTGKVHSLTANELSAATAYIAALTTGSVAAADIIADHATVGALDTNYAQVNMANVNNAWIQNGTVKDGAITNAMINSVSANKLTAGTIDASNITVTNLNADNITAGTLNGQRIGTGSLSLDKLEEDVYTETEVDGIVTNLQSQIDGAIETWTGTDVPTLNNAPASSWNTNSVKDTHVGDVYFVVNSQSDQNGYNYRFTKTTSGGTSTYSWQLIKDNDVTNALQRLTTAEGKIGTIEQFDSTVSSYMTNTDAELSSIKTAATTLAGRVDTAEGTLATKVDTSTFTTLSQTVDGHSSSITQLTTETTTLTQAVDTLNTKTSTGSGNIVQFSDSIGFKEIVVHGKSTQASYTGKNLFDINSISFGSNAGHATKTTTGVTATADLASGWAYVAAIVDISGASSVTLSTVPSKSTPRVGLEGYDANNTRIFSEGVTASTITHSVPDGVIRIRCIFYARQTSSGAVGDTCTYDNIQLELGSTATSYEPYVGGKPSPNPDYPQEIDSVDNLTLHVCRKNLFDETTWIEDGRIPSATTGVLASSTVSHRSELMRLNVGTYTYSLVNSRENGQKYIHAYDSNGIWLRMLVATAASGIGTTFSATFSIASDIAYICIVAQIDDTNVQLELGDTPTTYEPYQGQSIDIPLGDHQIRSLPDGTDDTLTFSYIGPSTHEGWGVFSKTLVQRVAYINLGDKNWVKDSNTSWNTFYSSFADIYSADDFDRPLVCTAFQYTTYHTPGNMPDESVAMTNSAALPILRVRCADYYSQYDAAQFKTAVSGVMLQYALPTPQIYDLGVVELPLPEDLNLWASTSPSTTINATWWHEPGRVEKNAIDISNTTSNLGDAIDSTTLPAPYTEVEWVESNGAQYVYLDWKPPVTTWGFEADFIIRNAFSASTGVWNPNTNSNGYGNVFGTRNASMTNDIQLGTYSTNGIIRWGQTGNDSAGLFKKDKTRQQISLRGTTLTKADGTTVTIIRSTEIDSKFYANMAVFCMHEGLRRGATGGIVQPGSVRIYSLKFYDGDELKVDLVGAIRNRDGITGLYDKVKDHFYPAYGMTYGNVVGDLGIPDTILEAVAKSKINVHIDNRQIARMWRVEVPELNRLEDGQKISVTFSTNIGATTPVAAGLVGWDETATTAYSNVFLKLVLADETETDWIPCFYAQGTRLTSHYGSGTPILLTYRENVLYGASTTNAGTSVMRAWYADPNYVDGNTQYTKYSNSTIAGLNGIKRYTLCMKDQNGKWTSIINQANTVAATKTCYTGGLQLDTILYYSPANEIAAGNNSSDGLWESYGIIDWRYSFNVENNATNGLTYRTPLYLVGTLSNSDGLFYLDTTKWWTQAPNDPTKIYVWVSAGYTNYYQGILSVQNTVYAYDEDSGLVEINVSRYSKTTTKLNQTIDTVDEHTQKIGVLETTIETKADGSDLTTVSNTLNTVSQTATSNSQKITNLTTRLGTNADGTAGVNDIIAKESALEQDLDGFKTTVSSTYSTKTELSAVQKDISDLQEGSKLSNTETGYIIAVDDALAAPPIDIIVYGKSKQAQTTGKNLFNPDKTPLGYYNTTGTFSTTNSYVWWSVPVAEGDVVRWANCTNNLCTTYLNDTFVVNYPDQRNSGTITIPAGVDEIRGYSGTGTLTTAIVTKNNADLTYEPYTGGKSSPSPDYQQEIKSIDTLTLHIRGKNLWDEQWALGAFNTTTGINTTSTDQIRSKNLIPVAGGVSYTAIIPNATTMWVLPYDGEQNVIANFNMTNGAMAGNCSPVNNNYRVLTTPDNCHYIKFYMTVAYGNTYNNNIQIQYGTIATDYESYIGTSASILLSDHSLRSLPDGTKDELDLAYLRPSSRAGWAWYSKTLVQRAYEADLGDLTWGRSTTYGYFSSGNLTPATISYGSQYVVPNAWCTAYIVRASAYITNLLPIGIDDSITTVNGNEIRVRDEQFTDVASFKAAVADVKIVYPLATPQTIDLGEVELPVMPSEHTIVWCDGGSVQSDISIDYWLTNAADIVPHLLDIDAVSKNEIKTVETRVSTAESTIEQHTGTIALKANSSDVYTKEQSDGLISIEVTNRNAAITTATNAINFSVSQTYTTKTEFNGLEIGGRNLLLGTATPLELSIGYLNPYQISSTIPDLNANDILTLSFDAKATISRWIDFYWVNTNLSTGGSSYNNTNNFYPAFQLTTDWEHYTYTGVVGVNVADILGMRMRQSASSHGASSTGCTVYLKNVKLEKGNKATDWSPAPEDTDTEISGLKSRVSTAESSITQNATNIELKVSKDGVISSINQSAELVKIQASKVEIDGTAIFNSISSSVDTSISNSISNAKLVKTTQDQWYSSTSATTKTGGSWATTQPSIVAGRYIWQRQYVTYSDNTTAYLPSEEGICTQGQTDLSGYSTTSQMTSAIGTAKEEALAVANSKRRIFTTTPTVPYDVGDLWVNGSSVKYCSTAKTDQGTYSESDWSVTATDDTTAESVMNTLNNQMGDTEYPYRQVEWIESNGRQFIYLDWKPLVETFGFEADFICRNANITTVATWNAETNASGYGNLFGTRNASGKNEFQLGSYSANGLLRCGTTTNLLQTGEFKTDHTRQQISLHGNIITGANGVARTFSRTATTNTSLSYTNMSVFGLSGSLRNNAGTFGIAQPGSMRIYSLKFYDGETLAVDLVPAIRNIDDVTGLYDRVSNHFYPAFGALYGDEVNVNLGTPKTLRQSINSEIPTLTQLDTSPTRMITANAPMFTELVDGQQFNIMLMHTPVKSVESERLAGWEKPTDNVAYVHVKLYLANNQETDWIPAFVNPTTRLTDHYKGGVSIPFVYRENYWANASTTANGTAIARGLIAGINYYDPGSNYYDRRLHNNAILAKTAIVAGHLIVSDGTGYYHVEAGATFNPAYTILYANAAIAATKTGANTYEALGSVAFTNTGTIENGDANKMLYLRCLPNDGMLTVSSTPLDDEETPNPLYLTTTPSAVDGNGNTYIYIPLGIMVNATQGYFASSKDMYAFINNKFIQINPSTIIATQKLYYRTTSLTAPTAPTTWITTNNPATYNAWNLAVPSLAASKEANATKYPYLYSVEQHKRVDGTVITGEVSNDSNTTIIDGGSIITNSITATQIAAGAITADKLDATNINASNSLTIGALSTSTQSSILNSELSADISAAAKRTDVSIAVTAIDYAAGTATLQASLYIDGVVTTSGVTYQWLKDGTSISGQTSRTLSVTSAMGLSHVYSCTATY